jgi:3-deoxy-D-manno-octulosonic-acid transferase
MEAFRQKHPDHLIFLTFFSPSGYEIRKNYAGADFIFYLPADTPANARKFIDLVHPGQAFFIKYEYWFNYLHELTSRKIQVYIISAIFRKEQHFFKPWGGWFRDQLNTITRFFVQDEDSGKLLASIGITNFTLSGDTRFDRVAAVAFQKKEVPFLQEFCDGNKILVAGSTWPPDEQILLSLINEKRPGLKFIIAPHETEAARISALISGISVPVVRYSEATAENVSAATVLVIDSIGMLSALYRYADLALIGGGFGAGIHNILEAAAFGVPVIFGPNYRKFKEARDLAGRGGAFSINSSEEFLKIATRLLTDNNFRSQCSGICGQYMKENVGATGRVLE